MKKMKIFITTLVLIVVLLSVVQVAVSNSLSTTGITLSKFEQSVKSLKQESMVLSEKLLFASSLTNIASKASELGFKEAQSEVFLTTPLPLAVKP